MGAGEGTNSRTHAILHGGGELAAGVDDVSLIRRTRMIARHFGGGRDHGQSSAREVQSGILPWRKVGSGGPEILLITSRGGNRWIIPKGWPMPSKSLRESARQEAYEEAGIRGDPDASPLGSFIADKTDFLGRSRRLEVVVYAMEVTEELADWPEKSERQRRWCTPQDAAAAVDCDTLRSLIQGFVEASRGAG